jgi:manganese/zinc/iron transport system substrate-binding protein
MRIRSLRFLMVVALLLTAIFPVAYAEDAKLNVVATTTMLADLARAIGGGRVHVDGLMGPGIDPHLYQASAGDVGLMQNADVVIYNGLHLEGKMGEIFEALGKRTGRSPCTPCALSAWSIWRSSHFPRSPAARSSAC